MCGFNVMMYQEIAEIILFVFMVALTVFCTCFLNYSLLLGNETVHLNGGPNNETAEIIKISLIDGIYSYEDGIANINWFITMILLVATLFFITKLGYAAYNCYIYWDTREFFVNALKIRDDELQDVTWSEVKKQLKEVQVRLFFLVLLS